MAVAFYTKRSSESQKKRSQQQDLTAYAKYSYVFLSSYLQLHRRI